MRRRQRVLRAASPDNRDELRAERKDQRQWNFFVQVPNLVRIWEFGLHDPPLTVLRWRRR